MKKVAVINDLSGFGKCSLSVALPIISVLGSQCVPLATAVFTSQTDFSYYYYTDLTDMIDKYIEYWKLNNASFDGIYSGYVTNHGQALLVSKFIDQFKTDKTKILIDPVMGDNGTTFKMFTNELLNTHKELTKKANIITPNLTESCLLADIPITSIAKCNNDKDSLLELAIKAANILKARANNDQEVIITGINTAIDNDHVVYNLVSDANGDYFTSTPMINKRFSGTGDIFASIITGLIMKDVDTLSAVKKAQDFIVSCINDTPDTTNPSDGVYFEKHLKDL
ncbi:pyridoxamine kinase [Lachnospira multipara]|uniref:pyridoxamine kinase n=1 Tax=Lachnospira multipara TaxID=28051 RepID=UPI0004E0D19F|nr:pyridoxamine kinase [Lachnospira multipara]